MSTRFTTKTYAATAEDAIAAGATLIRSHNRRISRKAQWFAEPVHKTPAGRIKWAVKVAW